MTEPSESVLVVEDEAPIREGVCALLESQGIRAEGVADGSRALERLTEARYDLVILDLMLPVLTGLEVLTRLRGRGDPTPVLILTARGAEEDVVEGLEGGADDYVTKPFGIRELVARVRALLRRPRREQQETVRVGEAHLDAVRSSIVHPRGTVAVTAREVMLLQYLFRRRPEAVTREELLVDVWGYRDGRVSTRTVDVHVQQLRAKLRAVEGGEGWISTARGRGYRFGAGDP